MNIPELTSYLQLAIFILGVFTILIAGVQDKKSRLAPAIYYSPTLIGFGLNPYLGVVGLVLTMLGLFFWKEKWNESFGLADALLGLAVLFCCLNINTLYFVLPITAGVLIELIFWRKFNEKQPLVWLYAKWIFIIFNLFIMISTAIGLGGIILG
jgi:hypothetical protein